MTWKSGSWKSERLSRPTSVCSISATPEVLCAMSLCLINCTSIKLWRLMHEYSVYQRQTELFNTPRRLNSWPTFSPYMYLYNRVKSELTCCNSLAWFVHTWVDTSSRLVSTDESVNKLQLQRSWIKLVRPPSTVDNTRYARVSHSRQYMRCQEFVLGTPEAEIRCLRPRAGEGFLWRGSEPPLHQIGSLRERRKLRQRGSRWSRDRKCILDALRAQKTRPPQVSFSPTPTSLFTK